MVEKNRSLDRESGKLGNGYPGQHDRIVSNSPVVVYFIAVIITGICIFFGVGQLYSRRYIFALVLCILSACFAAYGIRVLRGWLCR